MRQRRDDSRQLMYESLMLNPSAMDSVVRDQFPQMFEQAPGFMAVLEGSDYRFTYANLAFCQLFGNRDPQCH